MKSVSNWYGELVAFAELGFGSEMSYELCYVCLIDMFNDVNSNKQKKWT